MRGSRVVFAILLLTVGAAAGGDLRANEAGPINLPPALAAIDIPPRVEQALADLLARADASDDPDALRVARTRLVQAEDAGLAAVARLLATEAPSPRALPHLLHVVAVSAHPAVDTILAHVATDARVGLRILAADGLGAGRTAAAVDVLGRLARDPVPGVRAAALRALFALDEPDAVRIRQALPADARPDLHARRLAWHRQRGRASAALHDLARDAWRNGRTPEERLQGAMLLCSGRLGPRLDDAQRIVVEMGTDAVGAGLTRLALGVPRVGYDPLVMRKTAIMAAWAVLTHPDADEATRRQAIDRAVGWLARPVRLDPFDKRPIPETVLRMVLPDFGEAIVDSVRRRLHAGTFYDPQDGVFLLTEALDPELAAKELRALVDPDRVPPLSRGVRVAAASGLGLLGRIGDEALARRLLDPDETPVIRRDAVSALKKEEGAWAIPLLGELIREESSGLVDHAITVLESRPDEDARRLLIDHLFTPGASPYVRMQHVVEPADELAYQVLERALVHDEPSLRLEALGRLHRDASLHTERGRSLVRAFEPRETDRKRRTHELERHLYAYYGALPDEAVAHARSTWPEYERLGWSPIAMRSLQNLKAPSATPALVDFVLERVGWDGTKSDAEAPLLSAAASALEGRRGARDEELDRFWRYLLEHENGNLVEAAVTGLDHPGRGELHDALLSLLADLDPANPADSMRASAILDALEHQPVERFASILLDLILDPHADPALRRHAGRLLIGHTPPAVRKTLLAWLTHEDAGQEEPLVQSVVARIVGSGGGAEVATAAFAALEAALLERFAEERRLESDADADVALEQHVANERNLEPDAEPDVFLGLHVAALARAIAFTEHEETIARVAALLFLPRFAQFARSSVARQGDRCGPVDASAAARVGPTVNTLWHRAGGHYGPLPTEVWLVLNSLKVVPDEVLARSLRAAIENAKASNALALFPDVYFDRIAAHLHDKPTGDLTESAALIENLAWLAPPVAGAVDFGMARAQRDLAIEEHRFPDAAAAQQRALAILSRRAYDDEPGWNWKRERGIGVALAAARAAAEGRADDARRLFDEARQLSPYDPSILSSSAALHARTHFDLDQGLDDAMRALTLEKRRSPLAEASIPTGAALARVLLEREELADAVRIYARLSERVRRLDYLGGRLPLRWAEASASLGRLDEAAAALEEALRLEPTLETEARASPRLAALRERGRLEAIIDKMKLERFLDEE